MNSRRCEICNLDVHRASYIKHLRSKKHMENMKRAEHEIYNPRSLKQIAQDNIRLDDKQLNKELAKKMINP